MSKEEKLKDKSNEPLNIEKFAITNREELGDEINNMQIAFDSKDRKSIIESCQEILRYLDR